MTTIIGLSPEVMAKIQLMFRLSDRHNKGYECQAMGRIGYVDDDLIYIDDLDLPEQEARASEIDSDASQLMRWQQNRLMPAGGFTGPESIEAYNEEVLKWRIWLHTHPGFGTTYSSKDDECLANLAELSQDFFLGLVVTDELKFGVYMAYSVPTIMSAAVPKVMQTDFRLLTEKKWPVRTLFSLPKDEEEKFAAAFMEKVIPYSPPPPPANVSKWAGKNKDKSKGPKVIGVNTVEHDAVSEYRIHKVGNMKYKCITCNGDAFSGKRVALIEDPSETNMLRTRYVLLWEGTTCESCSSRAKDCVCGESQAAVNNRNDAELMLDDEFFFRYPLEVQDIVLGLPGPAKTHVVVGEPPAETTAVEDEVPSDAKAYLDWVNETHLGGGAYGLWE